MCAQVLHSQFGNLESCYVKSWLLLLGLRNLELGHLFSDLGILVRLSSEILQ